MAEWTSLQDIMQDLLVAQGCVIPGSLEIYNNSGPPQMSFVEEESEEQSYYQSEGSGDFTPFTHPDFELIQEMLNMVKQKDTSENQNPILTSDVDPLSIEFMPEKVQKKLKRNVAVSSILSTKESELAARRPVPKNVIPIMFKRKSSDKIKVDSESSSSSSISSSEKYKQYTPTMHANEYYSKYLENSKLREQFEEDIWSRAERDMKEVNGKKKLEGELATSQPPGFHAVGLLQHRHQLTGQCVVCSVASKHGYDFM